MNVELTADQEAFVEKVVAEGRYASSADAVTAALQMLEEREAKYARLKRDIADGLASGPGEAGSFAEVGRRARARWEAQQDSGSAAIVAAAE